MCRWDAIRINGIEGVSARQFAELAAMEAAIGAARGSRV